MKNQDKDLYACGVLEVKKLRCICIFCWLGEPGLVCWGSENEKDLQALKWDNFVQWQEESFGDSADLGLKFKVAGESSGLKLKGFVVLGDGSLAFSKGFFLEGDWSEVPGNV